MISFINSSKLSELEFESVVENIFMHTCIVKSDAGTRVEYVDSLSDIRRGGIFIVRDEKMYEGIIKKMEIRGKYFLPNRIEANGSNSLFLNKGGALILSFDIISFVLSAMYNKFKFEEKKNYIKYQEFRRYPFSEYLLTDFASELKEIVLKRNSIFAERAERKEPYFLPTFDFDRVKYFKTRKDILYPFLSLFFKNKIASEYLKIRKNQKSDPWDKLNEINEIAQKSNLSAVYFVFAEKKDIFTNRYSLADSKRIINKISLDSESGVHLTYESGRKKDKIKREIIRFSSIKKGALYSRFHYLFPVNKETAEILKEMKIEADFSVGMRGKIGFSNGFSKPYRLIIEGPLEFPVSLMDSAMVSEEKNENYPPEKIAEEIKNTSGVMTTIFHPSSLDKNTFCEYGGMFEKMISLSKINGMKNMRIKDMIEELSGYPVLKREVNVLRLDKSCKTDIRLYCKEGIKILRPEGNFKI